MSKLPKGNDVFGKIVENLSSITHVSSPHYLVRWHEFRDICRMAEENVTLNDALEKAEMLYLLIRDGKN